MPIAMFVGTADDLGDTTDARWARDQIETFAGNPNLHYEELPAGHASFAIGIDMSYVDRMITLVKKYNPTNLIE